VVAITGTETKVFEFDAMDEGLCVCLLEIECSVA
jgi:hypothetical protein